MKICVAQTNPVKGDILHNIGEHKKLIIMAADQRAEAIFFPELSLTGYEPSLAKDLAGTSADSRFDGFQVISEAYRLTIGAGMPVKIDDGIYIGMLLFQPGKARQVYAKKYLHPDEEKFFQCGKIAPGLTVNDTKIALAICYEITVPLHATDAFNSGAKIYVASVAKSPDGSEKAVKDLSAIATGYSMTTFMSNCVGHCDDFDCGGRTSVWNNKGVLQAQLNDVDTGILIYDTETGSTISKTITSSVPL